MSKDPILEIFDNMSAESYDESNIKLLPIKKNLHFLSTLILKKLPSKANILCVGVGTGTEVIDLANAYKDWKFVGIDPSESMLNGYKERIKSNKLTDRCDFFHGYLSEFKSDTKFDAVLCLYVMHFIKDLSERKQMYLDMNKFLKKSGLLIVSEISRNVDTKEFEDLFEMWKIMHKYAGAKESNLANMKKTFEEQLAVIPHDETVKLMKIGGFEKPVQFFQSFLIRAWFAQKAT